MLGIVSNLERTESPQETLAERQTSRKTLRSRIPSNYNYLQTIDEEDQNPLGKIVHN